MATAEEQLDRLASDRAIRDLALKYALYMDTRDVDAFAGLWAPAATAAEPPELNGASFGDGIERFFRSATASILFVGNHLIEFDDADHARGHVYCWAQADRGTFWMSQMVLYQDRYVRHEGEWLFESRRHLLWYGVPAPTHPREQPPMDWPHGDVRGSGSVGRGSLPEGFPSYRAFWNLAPGQSVDGRSVGVGDAK